MGVPPDGAEVARAAPLSRGNRSSLGPLTYGTTRTAPLAALVVKAA